MLLFILGILAAGFLVAARPQVAAAHDAPVINGSTTTYSSNHLTQIQTNIYHIVVNHLTTYVSSSGNAVRVQAGYGAWAWGDLTINHSGTSPAFLTGTTLGNFPNLILPASTSLLDFGVQYTGTTSRVRV